MREINLTFSTFGDRTLPLGQQGENLALQIKIDCTDVLEEYTNAYPALTLVSPNNVQYPGDVWVQEGIVLWQVRTIDTNVAGRGTARLDIVDSTGTVVRTALANTVVQETITPGEAPSQIDDWLDASSATLLAVNQALLNIDAVIENANAAADNADTRAEDANDAAEYARAKGDLANEKATLADTNAGLADTAASAANDAASAATTAAGTATTAAGAANDAALAANTAAGLVDTAIANAEAATEAANTAAGSVGTAIEDAGAATTAANRAAEAANYSAGQADSARQNALAAASEANTKANLANTNATLANEKAGIAAQAAADANTAALLADEKAGMANTAAATANAAAARVDAAISEAETATSAASNAAELANTKAELADTKATTANTAAQSATSAASAANTAATNAQNATGYIAPTYDATKTYAVGDYVIYSGGLYRCTIAIDTAEEWTAAHWSATDAGSDLIALKNALDTVNMGNVAYGSSGSKNVGSMTVEQNGNTIILNGTSSATSTQINTKVAITPPFNAWNASSTPSENLVYPLGLIPGHSYKLTATVISGTRSAGGGTGAIQFRFIDSSETVLNTARLEVTDAKASCQIVSDGTPVRLLVMVARLIEVSNLTIRVDVEDTTYYDSIETLKDEKLDSTYNIQFDWASAYGDETQPFGWETGYFNASGATGSSNTAIRTNRNVYYTARAGDKEITISVPDGKYASIVEYDANGANGVRHGNYNSGSNAVTIPVTEGNRYKFCVGTFDDASEYINETFLSNVVGTVRRSFLEWQKEQDARLDAIAGSSSIPDYYTSYLQSKLNDITNIQKTLSSKNDCFLFITDYHIRTNCGTSLALLKEVARKTGIQKIFFAGDAGGRIGGDSGYVVSMQKSAQVWSDLASCAEHFYGALGNHEWIDGSVYHIGAMFANYLNRFKVTGKGMSENGSYYIDDALCKIRYYFIQDSYGASALDYDWLGKSLEEIENGWYVAVIAHHGFIPGSASKDEYDGVELDTSTASHVIAKTITRILSAYQYHTTLSVRLSGVDYSWDFSNGSGGGVIGVFCGHFHHGTLFAQDDTENEWHVPVWRGSTDSMQAASVSEEIEGQKVPWYWANGVIGGTKVIRSPGTTDEQCFYAVQIDIESKTVHITAIGGDHDWEFDFL